MVTTLNSQTKEKEIALNKSIIKMNCSWACFLFFLHDSLVNRKHQEDGHIVTTDSKHGRNVANVSLHLY